MSNERALQKFGAISWSALLFDRHATATPIFTEMGRRSRLGSLEISNRLRLIHHTEMVVYQGGYLRRRSLLDPDLDPDPDFGPGSPCRELQLHSSLPVTMINNSNE